jgi:hypothetical protein
MSTSPERDEEQEAVDRAGPPRLYLPEDGTGLLYGPDGKPVDGEAEEDDDDGVPDDWPHVACAAVGSSAGACPKAGASCRTG